MAFTQAQLDALDAAIASGTRSVSYDGKRVEYGSLAEMLQVRALMADELGGDAERESMSDVAYFRKGS